MSPRKVVFLDRDGTICEERGPIRRFNDLRLLPRVSEVIKELRGLGFEVAIVSNQSAIAKGVVSAKEVTTVHVALMKSLKSQGAPLLGIRFCPHHPDARVDRFKRHCGCRKPAPGMLIQMARQFDIDLKGSWMVGDNLTDIQAGQGAGCRVALVLTGHGERFSLRVPQGTLQLNNLEDLPNAIQMDCATG